MKYFIILLCIFSFSLSVFSQEGLPAKAESESSKNPEVTAPCSPVILNGQTIFCFSEGVGAYSARERALSAEDRIIQASRDVSVDIQDIQSKQRSSGFDIYTPKSILVTLTAADLDQKSEVTLSDYALEKTNELRNQIRIDRSKRNPRELALGALYSLLTFIVLIIIFMILNKVMRHIRDFVDARVPALTRLFRVRSYELVTEERLSEVLNWFLQVFRFLVIFLILYLFIPTILSFFPWTANFAPVVWGYVLHPLKLVGSHLIDYFPKFIFILVTLFLSYYLLKFVRFLFVEIERGTIHFDGFYKEWAMPTYKLTRFFIFALVLVIIFPYLPGSSSPAFQGVSVFLGVLISFGSSSAIGNIVSGIVLTYMRPFRLGDRVKIADTVGDVIDKTLLVTHLRTIKNVDVTIPNAMVLGSHIVNYSSSAVSKGLILNMKVTIGYEVPWQKVHEALIKAALQTEHILKSPSPFVFQTMFKDFSVEYEINAYTHESLKMAQIYSSLHKNVQDSFAEAGIEILSPNYGVVRIESETKTEDGLRKKDS